MSENIRLFLADDHTLVREGIAALIGKQPDMTVVRQCGDGLKVVDAVLQAGPDVVVLDLIMPGLNGIDVCRQLTRKLKRAAILVLTMHADEEFIVKSLESGASGYMLKEAAAEQLVEAVRTVARGDLYLGTGVPRSVLGRLTGARNSDPYDLLTTREKQVLHLIAEGNTSKKTAETMGLSTKTVDTHRARLMRKLNIHDQTALIKYALRRKLVDL